MRRRVSFMVALVILISLGIGQVGGFIYENTIADMVYDIYIKAANDEENFIGDEATTQDVLYLKSVEEILNHNGDFTIRLERDSGFSLARGRGFQDNLSLMKIELPSGEFVAAAIRTENIIYNGGDISNDDLTLPIGKVVYEEINDTALNQLNADGNEDLDRTDFYIDMYGSSIYSKEYLTQMVSSIISLIFALIVFLIIRNIGITIGIYPAIFLTKKQKAKIEEATKSEWD